MDVDYDEEVEDTRPAGRRMKGRGGEDDDRYATWIDQFPRQTSLSLSFPGM